ncbi:MAG: hypothetical protein CFH34_00642 [Alphaproteobacteria bacterium MarineAlpha9_Bin4]|nr:MAG: hypothetical protein CFH34_00642 [Alphaproteobacteria bacterium MarineAlpha9_Bin4]
MSNESLSTNVNNEEENEKDTPLSDEEISRLIQASREDTFKIKEIKNEVSTNFKKVTLHDIAKKYSKDLEDKKEDINEKKQDDKESQGKVETKEEDDNLLEREDNKSKDSRLKEEGLKSLDKDPGPEEDENKNNFLEEKVIEKNEHLKILENEKKTSYEKGKETAYSEIKEGADSAIAKLNSISDKIAKTELHDLTELENLISDKILNLSSELTGKIIKALPTEFLKKIKNFVSSLDNNEGKIEILISEDDYTVLEKNKDIKAKLKEMNISKKTELQNGEVELLVNGIRIKQKLES